jgi:signal recognition particle receptor subunit alpha
MAALDFSMDSAPADGATRTPDLATLVDSGSLGTRTADGLYEVKDWEFSRSTSQANGTDTEEDDLIARALRNGSTTGEVEKKGSSGAGVFGSLFARLTGSKVLSEEDLKPVLEAMKQRLMQKNVAREIAEKVCEGVGENLVGQKIGGFQCALGSCPSQLTLGTDDDV